MEIAVTNLDFILLSVTQLQPEQWTLGSLSHLRTFLKQA